MQCMISKSNVRFKGKVAWTVELLHQHNAFVLIFFKTMYNKSIILFGFCDIQNNQSLSKCYQPQPSAFHPIIVFSKFSANYCISSFLIGQKTPTMSQ